MPFQKSSYSIAVKTKAILGAGTVENYGRTALTTFEAGFPCNMLNHWTLAEERDLQMQMFPPAYTLQSDQPTPSLSENIPAL